MQKGGGSDERAPWWTRLLLRLRGNKRLEIAVYGGVALLAVILYATALFPAKDNTPSAGGSAASERLQAETEAEIEERLREVLSCIRGAGRVEVMITYETGTQMVAAMSTSTNTTASETSDGDRASTSTQTTESAEPATIDGSDGNEPIILMEKTPTVRGVIVVAEGAADVKVRLDLQRAVKAVLNIPLSRIEVFELSKSSMD